ncbi:SAGA-associated factor, putative [Candida dubliniensis CD36]|uniref:SAGA-associated factor 11 n=1 Tax=Candida dubliniensis (strain CD36 / ATCC MYA-646 / CBS 7987 / NCPF 3949 / NRRL Y-17841) TaxID=573826 RepID=B9WEG0_CANDC|nr:SAGA-associated factor, putative [Candida dubliniensis CD36]CAX43072.1 SAGA-associated factor, putative [Candida dubliniensis CD36]
MTSTPITYKTLADSILNDLINNIIKQHTLTSLTNIKDHSSLLNSSNANLNSNGTASIIANNGGTSDENNTEMENSTIQDKSKLKQLETSRYFQCLNCGRNIAGGRFASHISKCLERKRK